MYNASPTPYPEINAVLEALHSEAKAILGERFTGMYLHGSLALGDFEPERSDIDFMVVTNQEVPSGMLPALEALHARLSDAFPRWGYELEGIYISKPSLRRYDPANAMHPHIERGGRLVVEFLDTGWIIQRHILREAGVALEGPDPKALIDPIAPGELRNAARALLHGWWEQLLDNPTYMRSSGYQVYAVLTMCRMLYTLEQGAIVSKAAAARWALDRLPERQAALVAEAEPWRNGDPFDRLGEVCDLIRYTLERSKEEGNNGW